MKTAICYFSYHHGNTLKVAEAMAEAGDVDLIDLRTRQTVHLEEYDCIGLASGIYGFSVHKSVVDFAMQYLPAKKPVFFVYTYGGAKGSGAKTLYQIAAEKGCPVLGEFSCRGFNTFGPFKLFGGSGKGLPSEEDLRRAKAFYQDLCQK